MDRSIWICQPAGVEPDPRLIMSYVRSTEAYLPDELSPMVGRRLEA